MTPPVRLVVFDLAGTTVDDGAQIVDAFTAALHPSGVTLGTDDIQRVRGTSKREAISRLLQPGRIIKDVPIVRIQCSVGSCSPHMRTRR